MITSNCNLRVEYKEIVITFYEARSAICASNKYFENLIEKVHYFVVVFLVFFYFISYSSSYNRSENISEKNK